MINRTMLLALLTLALNAAAGGVSPYIPINAAPGLESDIARLAVLANIPNLTRPYNLATVSRYLETIKASQPALYARLSRSLEKYSRRAGVTHAAAELAYSDDEQFLANRRGNTSGYDSQLSVRAQLQVNAHVAAYLGLEANNRIQQYSGSMLSLGVDWAQLDIGYKDWWWSPLQGSAQLLSTNAETLESISLSNNLPIHFLGVDWNYQIMAAQSSAQPVLYNARYSVGDKPKLAGVHVSFQPAPWWTLGISRILQFGGGERPLSLETLVRAFVDPRGTDNLASVDEESGNQIAALHSRMNFDGALPFSVTMELAGEDVGNSKEYQLGNSALSGGIYFPCFFSQAVSLNYEYVRWQSAWYVNNVYADGYSNEGVVMGHWAMQAQHMAGTAREGRSNYLNMQWRMTGERMVNLSARQSEHRSDAQLRYQPGWEVEVGYTLPWQAHNFSVGAVSGKNNFDEDYSQIRLTLEW